MTDQEGHLEVLEADVAEPTAEVVRRAGTFESFRHRAFTWFWLGSLVSNTGTWMQATALGIVVYGLRGREVDIGLVQFAQGIPVLLLALLAGVIADRVDKRKLLIWAQALSGVEAIALWALYRAGRLSPDRAIEGLAWIVGLGVAIGILSALTFPTWQSFLPDLVPRERLMNAIALNSAQFQSSRMLGPVAAGALIAAGFKTGDIFLFNAASFLFVIAALFAIRPCDISCRGDFEPAAKREGAWATLTAGLRYARDNRVVGMLLLSTAIMTVFALPYVMLMQPIADKVLHGADGGKLFYSWLLAANGFGAVVGSLGVASLPHGARRERLIPFAILAMSGILVAFSLSRSFWLSMALSALGGVAFVSTMSLTNTSIQSAAPGHLRGRVMSLFVLAFMGIMPLSAATFGPLGEWIGPANAVLVGAVVLGLWGVFLLLTGKLSPGDASPAGRDGEKEAS